MDVAIIGLGRMGAGVAERLIKAGHGVHVYNRTAEKAAPLQALGARVSTSLEELVTNLPTPRTVWLYLPAGTVTDEYIDQLMPLLQAGDTIIDGGNSKFSATVSRAALLAEQEISFIDVGTSGGTGGRTKGYCLMIGGSEKAVAAHAPLWEAISQVDGWRRVGPSGAGHYVKMVHNAIEYGMMQAYGEGMELLATGTFAGTLDLSQIADVWQHGSIINSYLGELLAEALHEYGDLAAIGSRVDDNGEGRWTVEEALDKAVPVPVLATAMFERYASRRPQRFAHKVVAILRTKFGGHATEGVPTPGSTV